MATTVGPARDEADNSFDRSSIASNVWLPVRRFHVGTSAKTLTQDAGYTTATDSRVDLPTASLFLPAGGVHIRAVRGRRHWTRANALAMVGSFSGLIMVSGNCFRYAFTSSIVCG